MHGAKQSTVLKSDALGRVSTSKAQREVLLDEFERSGLKGAQFARTAGGKYATFANWVQKRRHARGDYERKGRAGSGSQGGTLRLIEAVVTAEPVMQPKAEAAVEHPLEVLLPGGAKLLIASAHQLSVAAKLIQALARSC
jgi:ClpP class serine protease